MSHLEGGPSRRAVLVGLVAVTFATGCTTERRQGPVMSSTGSEEERTKRIHRFLQEKGNYREVPRSNPNIGGVWIAPDQDSIVPHGDPLTLSAEVRIPEDAPPLDWLIFTGSIQEVKPQVPGTWTIFDAIQPDMLYGDTASTTVNLRELGAQPGSGKLSFDVFTANKGYKKAPHGLRRIILS